MHENAVCGIVGAYREITPEGGIGAVLTELHHAWDEVMEQLNSRQ